MRKTARKVAAAGRQPRKSPAWLAPDAAAPPPRREYPIDELARSAGTTVRNVRAYQDRGLLPPPQRRGRAGIYTEAHLARLRVIGRMLERGYTLANISELIDAWEHGHELSQLLGLEAAITSPWSDEEPVTLTAAELLAFFDGRPLAPAAMASALQLGLIAPDGAGGTGFRVSSLKTLRTGAELAREGIPLEELLGVIKGLRTNVERVAGELVQLVMKHVFDRYGTDRLPPAEHVPRLADFVWRLRPLAMKAVDAEVARAMEQAANRFLGDRLAAVLDHLGAARRGDP